MAAEILLPQTQYLSIRHHAALYCGGKQGDSSSESPQWNVMIEKERNRLHIYVVLKMQWDRKIACTICIYIK